ncbi:hypothetical protein BDW02DRAFT_613931 [Decorospora gaudefroyi]|uniref:Uncharacterized protein n=1 Tax=Decorospora gaudefroyi TaxID=184978 RepID=A0A6A5JWC0_9PLEO|nr:hypothetical protein BDW02DRAFT_613931 [Decorospora gaudefroyi]
MSSLPAQLPSDREGVKPDDDESQSISHPKDSALHGGGMSETTQPGEAEACKDKLWAFISTVQNSEDGKCFDMLGSDGVWRVLHWLPTPPDRPTGVEVYDAKPMSPEMIKLYLDRLPWRQEVEDRFRGVDGRLVPQEQWIHPPPGIIPPMGTKNERLEEMRKSREERMQLEQKVERGEISKKALGPACNGVQSDYDLRPR